MIGFVIRLIFEPLSVNILDNALNSFGSFHLIQEYNFSVLLCIHLESKLLVSDLASDDTYSRGVQNIGHLHV